MRDTKHWSTRYRHVPCRGYLGLSSWFHVKEGGDELAAGEIVPSLPKSIEVDVVEPRTPDEWLSAVVRSSVAVGEGISLERRPEQFESLLARKVNDDSVGGGRSGP